MSLLILKNADFGFSEKIVLSGVSGALGKGSYCLEGLNGSGKTTTIKTLAGILKPVSGAIEVNGFNIVTEAFSAKSHLSYMPDKPCVYPFMTGNDLIAMVSYFKQVVVGSATMKMVEELGIDSYLDASFDSMSLGTQRKFTFVCALLGEPKVLLLDEPMNGFDKASIEVMCSMLRDIADSTVILFSSHQPKLKEYLAATVLEISEKKLLGMA